MKNFTRDLSSLRISDVPEVGGKNASLGEMIYVLSKKGVNVPGGFATTAEAFRYFLKESKSQTRGENLGDFIRNTLKDLDVKNLSDLQKRGRMIREAVAVFQIPEDLKQAVCVAYRKMKKKWGENVDVAVRSSATAEDLPDASFAGQQETYLNVRGEEALLAATKRCFASLFTDRAISYRQARGFDHLKVALSVGVQKMVRSDISSSGVMFTLDTESGFPDTVLINGSWGLGEMIVQGEVIPDEFLVYKPFILGGRFDTNKKYSRTGMSEKEKLVPIISKTLGKKDRKMIYSSGAKNTKIIPSSDKEKKSFSLSDEEILTLAEWGALIEEHYSKARRRWMPMDIEWAKDGKDGKLYIVQARPETVQSRRDFSKIQEYRLLEEGKILARGASVGSKIASGKARIILDVKGMHDFRKGEVLVTDMTDPDWEPIMKIASAIVTDKGGRTSHAAIVSRELGIPCIVGSQSATRKIKTGDIVTVDTTGSEGVVYKGSLRFKILEQNIKKIPKLKTKIMVNIATPDMAFEKSFLPVSGVGLAREEFIIASEIGIHPNLLVDFDKIKGNNFKFSTPDLQMKSKLQKSKYLRRIVKEVEKKTAGYKDKKQFYVDKLAYGVAKIAAAFYPRPVILRFSDFKTNEYRQLLGGEIYEPQEENPMIGWRGASRYYHPLFEKAFELETKAVKKVREEMGLTNLQVMIPMCRTVEEGKKVIALMAKYGLKRGSALKVFVMCEIPSNVLLAEEFLSIFDGMSIGSNDLAQLTLGIDRDGNERIRNIANENDASVKKLITQTIAICLKKKKYIGICGQAPSDYPEFAEFLVGEKIESISLNPDAVVPTIMHISKKLR